MGSRHFAIGCAGAAALAIYGLQTGDAATVASALPVPLAVMWPDIDHPRSKLGRQRAELMDKVFAVVRIVLIGTYLLSILSEVGPALLSQTLTVNMFIAALLSTSITFLPVTVCMVIATSDKFKKSTKFFTKHRGIMHTLIPVLGLVIGGITMSSKIVTPFINGCAIGYTLHLLADMETVEGCPILWPLTSKSISLLPVRTNTKMEIMVCALDCGILICLPYLLLGVF